MAILYEAEMKIKIKKLKKKFIISNKIQIQKHPELFRKKKAFCK